MKGIHWVRAVLLLQVLFFLGWTAKEEAKRHNASTVILETLPVDPRDLLAGKYMDLRYVIGQLNETQGFPSPAPAPGSRLWVKLKPLGEARVAERVIRVWKPAGCFLGAVRPLEATDGEIWVAGTCGNDGRVVYGIERYYFNETRAEELNGIRSGHVWVEAIVSRNGALAFKRLIY